MKMGNTQDPKKVAIVNLIVLAVGADVAKILAGLVPYLLNDKHESRIDLEESFFDSIISKATFSFQEIHTELNNKKHKLAHNNKLFEAVVGQVKLYEIETLEFLNNFKKSSNSTKDFYKSRLISTEVHLKHFNSNSFLLCLALFISITKAKELNLEIEDLLDELLSKHIFDFYMNLRDKKLNETLKDFSELSKTRIKNDIIGYDNYFKKIIPRYHKYKLRENLKKSLLNNKLRFDSKASIDQLSKLDFNKLEGVIKELGFYLAGLGDFDSLILKVNEASIVSVVGNTQEEVINNFHDL